jgi:tetraprenyl-beta-curcumene synthase
VIAAETARPLQRRRARARGSFKALAIANIRFWPTVAPHVQRALGSWDGPAREIPDARLRQLALSKLAHERFNAEVAATLATLAPRQRRSRTVQAIVALELLFDYLDGRTEAPYARGITERAELFAPFIDAFALHPGARKQPANSDGHAGPADWRYLTELSTSARDAMFSLPAAPAVAACARAGAERCAQAQARLHAVPELGQQQLQDWAGQHGSDSGLQWREYSAGSASSVLAAHALIAAAANPASSEQDAARIDAAYLAICAVITILDSVVDQAQDRARGERGFIDLYEPGELPERMRRLTREALLRAHEAPNGDHHAMTLAGVVAYYTSHPGASDQGAREVVALVRNELSPTVWPALALMRGWRSAKAVRKLALDTRSRQSDRHGAQ